MGTTRRILLAALGCALLATAAPALAHDHRPPRTFLEIDEQRQRGRFVTYSWTKSSPPYCVWTHADGFYTWADPLILRRGHESSILLAKTAPPEHVRLVAYERVSEYGYPLGKARRIETSLVPRVTANGPAWAVAFEPPNWRHAYLVLNASWLEQEMCSGIPPRGSDSGMWTFHLRRAQA